MMQCPIVLLRFCPGGLGSRRIATGSLGHTLYAECIGQAAAQVAPAGDVDGFFQAWDRRRGISLQHIGACQCGQTAHDHFDIILGPAQGYSVLGPAQGYSGFHQRRHFVILSHRDQRLCQVDLEQAFPVGFIQGFDLRQSAAVLTLGFAVSASL